jgi:hypothetical protein
MENLIPGGKILQKGKGEGAREPVEGEVTGGIEDFNAQEKIPRSTRF